MIRLLIFAPFAPAARKQLRARVALSLVRLAARLDVVIVVLSASAIAQTVDMLNAEQMRNEKAPERPWPSTLN